MNSSPYDSCSQRPSLNISPANIQDNELSVAGEWHGSYRDMHSSSELRSREFTASLQGTPFGETNLFGEMLACGTSDGPESIVIGSQNGAVVRFSKGSAKQGVPPSGTRRALDFVGIVSDDGAVMRGCWRLAPAPGAPSGAVAGTWMARRA